MNLKKNVGAVLQHWRTKMPARELTLEDCALHGRIKPISSNWVSALPCLGDNNEGLLMAKA